MKQQKSAKPRNLLHDHPLLRKGGAHGKSRKARRRATKMEMRREWYPHSAVAQSAVPIPLSALHCA